MIDVLTSASHYADHLAAVFGALPLEARGSFIAPGPAGDRVRALGFHPEAGPGDPDRPTLVASYGDLRRAVGRRRTRLAMMEHGAGQSYGGRPHSGRSGSYAGGQHREAASLFLHPGPHPAARDRAAYPAARVEVVGSPHLDTLPRREGTPDSVVAVSFHANMVIAPETRSAHSWAMPAVLGLRGRFPLIGHAHPRDWLHMDRVYRRAGIEAVRQFTDVCRRADVYVCDNSSTLFAFAATGRPVVVLNPPWYDRKIQHGLRFWEAADIGVNCNDPRALPECIEEALADTPEQRAKREAAVDLVYAYREGASRRAAEALMDWAA